MANKQKEKGNKPDFIIRAKQSADSEFYLTLGAAWKIEVNGQEALSLKFNSFPVAWDGSAVALTPKED